MTPLYYLILFYTSIFLFLSFKIFNTMRYMGAHQEQVTVNKGGRPREHDREQIAKDIVAWAAKPDSINLNKFCFYYEPKIPPTQISIWANQCPLFRKAYETAKSAIGFRREEMLNNESLHVKAYDLNAKTYDFFLKEESREESQFQSSLKQKEIASYTQADLDRQKQTVDQVLRAQEASSARKAADKISKSD